MTSTVFTVMDPDCVAVWNYCCVSTSFIFQNKSVISKKFQQSTIAICRCLHWIVWSTLAVVLVNLTQQDLRELCLLFRLLVFVCSSWEMVVPFFSMTARPPLSKHKVQFSLEEKCSRNSHTSHLMTSKCVFQWHLYVWKSTLIGTWNLFCYIWDVFRLVWV